MNVTVDGQQVFSLQSSDKDPVARSVSSNWCIIPLEPEDAGKRFTVELTPLIADMLPREVEFLVGSNYNIVLGQLREDTPQLIMAMLCIALGLIIFLIQCYLQIFTGTSQWDQMFMGVFSVILGIWRITDIRSAPLIFSGNPKLLGYVSIGMLFLASPALIQFVSIHFREKQARKVYILTIVISALGMVALLGQLMGRFDMEESRILSHIALVVGMVMVVIASFYGGKGSKDAKKQLNWKLLPLLAVGIALDILIYYVRRSSSDLIYTCLFFLIFLSISFIGGFRETSRMVYRDVRTGLYNKVRWNELMQTEADSHMGILVIDMNGLKRVNDTYGHEAGDRMIIAFADILRNTLPSSCVICRWGGDEFMVMFTRTSRKNLDYYTDALYRATEEYNSTGPEVELYFAMGAVLAEEHPGMSCSEMARLADERMYHNKQAWYREKKKKEENS